VVKVSVFYPNSAGCKFDMNCIELANSMS
jgi:hypothetical protein